VINLENATSTNNANTRKYTHMIALDNRAVTVPHCYIFFSIPNLFRRCFSYPNPVITTANSTL